MIGRIASLSTNLPIGDESMDQLNPGERRQHERYLCQGMMRLRVIPRGGEVKGEVLNLSLGGCLILIEEEVEIAKGEPVELQLMVENFQLNVTGQVKHIHARTMIGVQFSEMNDRLTEQVRYMIAELYELERKLDRVYMEKYRIARAQV